MCGTMCGAYNPNNLNNDVKSRVFDVKLGNLRRKQKLTSNPP